jgi:hypothetical protein
MDEKRGKYRFWPILGIVLSVDFVLVLLYTLIIPGLTGRTLSDSLCTSAVFLGLLAAVPVLLDMGRGIGMAGKMAGGREKHQAALEQEHQRRDQGITITFAVATATLIVTVLSLILGLL